jgi:hypothetical protein
MDQGAICLFLAMKQLSAKAIHSELVAVLGPDVIAYSTLTKYLRQHQFPSIPCEAPNEHPATVIDEAILNALDKPPFSSVRELAQLTCIPRSTVHRHLTQSLGFVVKHLRWIPHNLTATPQVQRVTLANELLLELCLIKDRGWKFSITLDESWFYLVTDHEQIWLRPEETPPERAKHTIQDRKIMVTIAWNPLGFHLIQSLPKGCSFNADYYRDNILAALTPLHPGPDGRQLVLHADNARSHTARKCRTFCAENGLQLAPHPPYSPDLAPSDFFLFGYVKAKLQGMEFLSDQELLEAIREVVSGIASDTLNAVFEEWMERLEWVSKNNGDSYP